MNDLVISINEKEIAEKYFRLADPDVITAITSEMKQGSEKNKKGVYEVIGSASYVAFLEYAAKHILYTEGYQNNLVMAKKILFRYTVMFCYAATLKITKHHIKEFDEALNDGLRIEYLLKDFNDSNPAAFYKYMAKGIYTDKYTYNPNKESTHNKAMRNVHNILTTSYDYFSKTTDIVKMNDSKVIKMDMLIANIIHDDKQFENYEITLDEKNVEILDSLCKTNSDNRIATRRVACALLHELVMNYDDLIPIKPIKHYNTSFINMGMKSSKKNIMLFDFVDGDNLMRLNKTSLINKTLRFTHKIDDKTSEYILDKDGLRLEK